MYVSVLSAVPNNIPKDVPTKGKEVITGEGGENMPIVRIISVSCF
jgi:hypothetical protein